MSEADKERLYALMAMAEDTQKAAAAAVEELRAERAAFAQQVEVVRMLAAGLDEALHRLDGVAATLDDAGPRLAATAAAAVCDTVARTMQAEAVGRDEAAATATHGAITAAVGKQAETLQAMTERTAATAKAVEGRFRSAAAGLGWRWMATAAVGMVAGVAALVGAGFGMQWWQGGRIESQRATIEELAPEVERLRGLTSQLPQGSLIPCSAEGPGTCVFVDDRYSSSSPEDPEHRTLRPVYGTGYEPDS